MFRWRTIKRFPKLALVGGIIVGSSILFFFWWVQRPREKGPAQPSGSVALPSKAWVDTLPDRMDRLFMAGSDLYDAENGEKVAERWLGGDEPLMLHYQASQKKVLGRFERGFVRYNLDGTREGELSERFGLGFVSNFTQAVFAREGDMWIAEIDWANLKLLKERRVTKVGSIQESFMIQNLVMWGKRYLILQNMNALLMINMSTGAVNRAGITLSTLPKGRSPDGTVLIGDDPNNRRFYAFNLDNSSTEWHSVDDLKLVDIQWLSDDRALVLVGGTQLVSYDRPKNKFSNLMKLAGGYQKLTAPSPDGRFVLAYGGNLPLLIDLKEVKSSVYQGYISSWEWIGDHGLLLSNDVPDTALRGAWFREFGKASVQILPDPLLTTRNGEPILISIPATGWVVFATNEGLYRINKNAQELKELVKPVPVPKLQPILTWPH